MSENKLPLPRTLLTCKRCGYRWFTSRANTQLPKICPECKSPYWNEDKKRHLKNPAKYRGDVVAETKPLIMTVPPAPVTNYPDPELLGD